MPKNRKMQEIAEKPVSSFAMIPNISVTEKTRDNNPKSAQESKLFEDKMGVKLPVMDKLSPYQREYEYFKHKMPTPNLSDLVLCDKCFAFNIKRQYEKYKKACTTAPPIYHSDVQKDYGQSIGALEASHKETQRSKSADPHKLEPPIKKPIPKSYKSQTKKEKTSQGLEYIPYIPVLEKKQTLDKYKNGDKNDGSNSQMGELIFHQSDISAFQPIQKRVYTKKSGDSTKCKAKNSEKLTANNTNSDNVIQQQVLAPMSEVDLEEWVEKLFGDGGLLKNNDIM